MNDSRLGQPQIAKTAMLIRKPVADVLMAFITQGHGRVLV